MNHDADAAREGARRADGKFGHQPQPEAEVELPPTASGPTEGEPWEAGHWDGMVIALQSRRKDPGYCLVELQDAARDMGKLEVFDRLAYRTRSSAEDFDRIFAELSAGRRGRHLLNGEPLPAQTVEAVADALHFEGMDLEALGVSDDEAAAELARVAVEAEHGTSRDAMATHMEVNWRADRRSAKYASGSVCEAFGIPDHRAGFGY